MPVPGYRGALGDAHAMLAIRRALDGEGAARRLSLSRDEARLSRPVGPPARQGFGLDLLQRSLPYELDARTELAFRAEGLRFAMSLPLPG